MPPCCMVTSRTTKTASITCSSSERYRMRPAASRHSSRWHSTRRTRRCNIFRPLPACWTSNRLRSAVWWHEAIFQCRTGVTHVESGYRGGQIENPTYRQVCGGDTGHVEVVRVTFNPDEITYRELLDVFFTVHDPTTLNRQGNDAGEQYSSAIF